MEVEVNKRREGIENLDIVWTMGMGASALRLEQLSYSHSHTDTVDAQREDNQIGGFGGVLVFRPNMSWIFV